MSHPSRRSLTLSDGNISYLAWDGDGPTLHFAHATGFNAETYAPLLTPLSEHMRILASDARGHGFTTLPTVPGSARDWKIFGRDLGQFLDATTDGQVVLAGHSMGAVVSAMIAARWPDRVKGLILLEPVLVPNILHLVRWIPFRPPSVDLASRAERRRASFASFEVARASYLGRGAFRTWPPEFLTAYLKGGLVPDGDGVRLACAPTWEAQVFRAAPFGAASLARRIKCPVTLMYAEQSTPPESECRLFAHRHGNTRLIKVPGTTHFLPMERPDLVREEIARFG
ncbi:MAG TPA: alpha/beta hydrolase [Rhizomicrobium sp.]|nr:alpha/beta hydrolase [Rhizomicrobium sp.]